MIVVGVGATSVVVGAHDKLTSENVAVKKVKDIFSCNDYTRRVLREIKLQRVLGQH